jgi:hypothetical protein
MYSGTNLVLAVALLVLMAWALFDLGFKVGHRKAGRVFIGVLEGMAKRRLELAAQASQFSYGLAGDAIAECDDNGYEYDCDDYDECGDDDSDELDEADEEAFSGFNLCDGCPHPCEVGVKLGFVAPEVLAKYQAEQAALAIPKDEDDMTPEAGEVMAHMVEELEAA